MIVHKLSAGSIQDNDLIEFKRMVEQHANSNAVYFVLTEGETASENKSLIEDITQQVKQQIAQEIQVFVVSNTAYQKGNLDHKDALIQFSGIPKLKSDLELKLIQIAQSYLSQRNKKKNKAIQACLNDIKNKQEITEIELDVLNVKQTVQQYRFILNAREFQNEVISKIQQINSI